VGWWCCESPRQAKAKVSEFPAWDLPLRRARRSSQVLQEDTPRRAQEPARPARRAQEAMSEEIKPATLSKAFVTGGSGFLGRHLIRRLRSDGIKCVAIARSVRAGQLVETEGAEAVMGDVLDAEALARGMAGCDVVFHCAWQGLDMRQPLEAIWPVNVGGTQEVARAAAKVRRDWSMRLIAAHSRFAYRLACGAWSS